MQQVQQKWKTHFLEKKKKKKHVHVALALRRQLLTHISLASFLWDIGKQCKTRSNAAKRGVWSGSPLFAYRCVL